MRYSSAIETELKKYNLEMYVNNVKCALTTLTPSNTWVGQEFKVGDVLTIKGINNYILMDTGNYYSDFLTNSVYQFTVSADKKSGTITVNSNFNYDEGFNFATKPTTVAATKKTVNNIYLLKPDVVRNVLKDSFATPNGDGTAVVHSDGIIGLINLMFPIDTKYKLSETFVMIGDYNTNLKGMELNTDTITVDMGIIKVPVVDGDLSDYEGVEVVLNLPFSEPIKLNPADVMGYSVKLEYWINLYNGECVINIISSKTARVIEVKKIDLKVDVPFNRVQNTPQRNAFNAIGNTGFNGLNKAYIQVNKYDLILKNGFYTNPIIDEKKLTTEKGYIEIENINLTFNATLDEKSKITNLLRNGVIIK